MNTSYNWLKKTKAGNSLLKSCQRIGVKYASPELTAEHILAALLASKGSKELFKLKPLLQATLLESTIEHIKTNAQPSPKKTNELNFSADFNNRFWACVDNVLKEFGYEKPVPQVYIYTFIYEYYCYAGRLLKDSGITVPLVRRCLVHKKDFLVFDRSSNFCEENDVEKIEPSAPQPKIRENKRSSDHSVEDLVIELTEEARMGRIEPVIGRDDELERLKRIIHRKKKSCPILVGDAGVGKSSIVEGFAWKIANDMTYNKMSTFKIYSLSPMNLIANSTYHGEFEERLRNVISIVENDPHAILFIDEIHSFVTLGGQFRNSPNPMNFLKSGIAKGSIRCIGTTTNEEYRMFIESDKALSRRFQKIVVNEPSVKDTFEILKNTCKSYTKFHHVEFSDGTLRLAIELSMKYMPDRQLPDKALEIIDEIGSKYRSGKRIQGKYFNPFTAPDNDGNAIATEEDVREAVCSICNMKSLPVNEVRQKDNQLQPLKHLEENMKKRIFGQDKCIKILCDTVKTAKCGLISDSDGTLGNFFFAGSSGVGKTEVAKQLASELYLNLIRFDMSEYSDQHAVARFIGSDPGLVGYENGGLLVNAVRTTPNCVLLLDEMEKAHQSVHNLLLQIMDSGTLTDSKGNKADFHNCILIMTGNTGCSEANIKRARFGFNPSLNGTVDEDSIANAMRNSFSPEFRARLTACVVFNPLSQEAISIIVKNKFSSLAARAEKHGVKATMTDKAHDELVRIVMLMGQGARPVEKLLQTHIAAKLADMMISNTGASRIEVDFNKDFFFVKV